MTSPARDVSGDLSGWAWPAPGDGGVAHPRGGARVENALLGTAIFVGAEAMLFAGMISAFLILRAGASEWPPLGQPRLPLGWTTLNTMILVWSVVPMTRATRAAQEGRPRDVRPPLVTTAVLGTIFVVIQGSEWLRLLHYGLTASASLYGGTFYALIGCHGAHVVAGVLTLLVLLARVPRRGAAPLRGAFQACRLYWLFVVGLWPILFVLVYLA